MGNYGGAPTLRTFNSFFYYSVWGYGKQKITFGVATKIPIGCSQESIETYDGINYYHYKCTSQLPATNNANLHFAWEGCGYRIDTWSDGIIQVDSNDTHDTCKSKTVNGVRFSGANSSGSGWNVIDANGVRIRIKSVDRL